MTQDQKQVEKELNEMDQNQMKEVIRHLAAALTEANDQIDHNVYQGTRIGFNRG